MQFRGEFQSMLSVTGLRWSSVLVQFKREFSLSSKKFTHSHVASSDDKLSAESHLLPLTRKGQRLFLSQNSIVQNINLFLYVFVYIELLTIHIN